MSRGLAAMAAVASLSASDLREAIVRLPVPTVVSAILLQIVHQTATLFYETTRVARPRLRRRLDPPAPRRAH